MIPAHMESDAPALTLAHQDFPVLKPEETVLSVLNRFRSGGLPHKIVYLYVVDGEGHLLGVLPTRQLLTARPEVKVADIFVKRVISLPHTTTLREARRAFSRFKFLAFPIVDETKRVLGVIDIERFAGDLGNLQERTRFDDIYELMGIETSIESESSAWSGFRMRFPWLIATIISGTLAALLTSVFETTLEKALILAFFLTMVLGLNESVAMQSATLALQRLHRTKLSFRYFVFSLRIETFTSVLLGMGCAFTAGTLVFVWRSDLMSAVSIGCSLFLSIIASCCWGMTVPFVLRSMNKDPKVAAAPVALGLSDLTTLFLYFSLAWLVLR